MDPWLRNMLIETGRMSQQGLTRNARVIPCRHCKLPTIAGFDADMCALDAWCDIDELNPRHEIQALLDNRNTYELVPHGGGRYRFTYRDQWRVKTPPNHPLLATHRCDDPLNPEWLAPEQLEIPIPTHDPNHIPF
jgi:hypothetical protein